MIWLLLTLPLSPKAWFCCKTGINFYIILTYFSLCLVLCYGQWIFSCWFLLWPVLHFSDLALLINFYSYFKNQP